VGVIEHQRSQSLFNEIRLTHLCSQSLDSGTQVEGSNGVTVVCGRPQGSQHEVETVRHTIARHFSLMELNLMENGFQAI